jgi:deoxyribose-phosphate aldolase
MPAAPENLAATLDHTLLRPDCTEAQITQLCREARQHGFASACVPPCYVPVAARELSGSGVAVCTVIGFPLGYNSPRVKFREAEIALGEGATELDLVLNVSALKSGNLAAVKAEVEDLADLCDVNDALLKVIIETALLTEEEMETAARLCAEAGQPGRVGGRCGAAAPGAARRGAHQGQRRHSHAGAGAGLASGGSRPPGHV